MSWSEFRYDQADLALLCRERVVHASEYHIWNQLYGQAQLLKDYAGLPADEPLPWAMQHAIHFDDDSRVDTPEDETSLPTVLAVTELEAEMLRRRIAARVESIGSAYFYMRALWQRRHAQEESAVERRGTVVFPDKSTVNQRTVYDRERFARDLAALPSEFQPVVVSVFWKDYQNGDHRPFERAGLPLVTSGHSYDPLFLFRFHDLCRRFKYSCANDLSTSFCVSVLSGCHFFYWPTGLLHVTRAGETRTFDEEPTLSLPGKQACIAASPFPPIDNGAAQRRLAERYAGAAAVRTPRFFRRLAKRSRRTLQAVAPPAVTFAPDARLSEAAGWLPCGIEADGWVVSECEFTAPRNAADGIQVALLVPQRAATEWRGALTLRLGRREKKFAVHAGYWLLDLPGLRWKRSRKVALCCDGEVTVDADRRRSFRILSIARAGGVQAVALRPGEPPS